MPDDAVARPVILCADDYALAPGVSRGILELVQTGRLSATSCMSVSRFWPEHAGWLRPFADRVDIGLHLTLTGLPPLGSMPGLAPAGRPPGLGPLMLRALVHRLDGAEIEAELTRQLDAFEQHFGAPPAFLDGHQHVHQLPVVRAALLALYQRRLAGSGCYVRLCDEPLVAVWRRGTDRWRALLIALLGRGLGRAARRRGIPGNDSFRGVQDFAQRRPFAHMFESYLYGAGSLPLIMCHPGHVDAALAAVDPVTDEREEEWRYFSSAEFPTALARAGLVLGRFPRH